MPVKRYKDRTGLIARGSLLVSHVYERRSSGVGGFPSRKYIALYLWSKPDQMRRAAALENGTRCVGCHCPTPVRIRIRENGDEELPRLMLGELHFAAGRWTDEVVAHELMHALFESQRSDVGADFSPRDPDQPFSHEEEWCYRFGRWFSSTYRWLWKHDPTLTHALAVRDDGEDGGERE